MHRQTDLTSVSERRESLSLLVGTGSLYAEASGPYTATHGLARALADASQHIVVVGTRDRWFQAEPTHFPGIELHAFRKMGPYALHWAPGIGCWLRRIGRPIDVVLLHGPWVHSNYILARWAVHHRIPYVMTVHGTMSPGALAVSRVKKAVMQRWFGEYALSHAACFQALTRGEHDDIRRFGLKQPICVVPNGIELPNPKPAGRSTAIDRSVDGASICLYLGRLHPIKGLDMLINAWASIASSYPDWKLVMAGPDENGYAARLRQQVRDNGLDQSVLFVGPQYGQDKTDWFSAADIFVLPSRSEGLSNAVLEAMAHRIPVLLTTACDLSEVEEQGAGIVVETSVSGIQSGLLRLLTTPEEKRRRMGEAGFQLVATQYQWSQVAHEIVAVCRWLRGEQPQPATVTLN